MYILLDTCQNPMILRIIYFASLLLDIAFVLIPIGLIVMMMVDFSKVVISGDEKDIKNTKLIGKRVIYAIVVFCIPWIVNVLMDFLDGIGLSVSYRTCITNAKSGNFDYYDELLKIEEKVMEEQKKNTVIVEDKNNHKDNNSGNNKPDTNVPSTDTDNDDTPSTDKPSTDKPSTGKDTSNITPSIINKGDVVSKDPSSKGESSASNGSLVLAANSLVNTALGEVGRNNNNLKYGNSSNAWCAYFTTWALKNTKMSDGSTLYSYLNKNGSISDGIASGLWPAFQGNRVSGLGFYKSKTYGGSYTPKIGDIIWFQWKNGYCRNNYGKWNGSNKCADHVGIITSVSGSTIHTVEGNSGSPGTVKEKEYNTSDEIVIAYGTFY